MGRTLALTVTLGFLPSCCSAWGIEDHQIVAHSARTRPRKPRSALPESGHSI